MLQQMLRDLTDGSIITTLGRESAKAHAAGIAAALLSVFVGGFQEGFEPAIAELGVTLGAAAGNYVVAHVAAWLVPNPPR